jgi:DNA transposition AAA+ family ATPase
MIIPNRNGRFISTGEYRKFVEFADTIRKDRTIGICHGPAGVGKTLSARHYSHWDIAEPLVTTWGPREASDQEVYRRLEQSRAFFFTAPVGGTLTAIKREIDHLAPRVSACIEQGNKSLNRDDVSRFPLMHIELLIVDEAERLKANALDYLRDLFDKSNSGLILIGMPGVERLLSRYPQFYSRIGFSHRYSSLTDDEIKFVLKDKWKGVEDKIDLEETEAARAFSSIWRLTGGNFRLLHRLLLQIDRVLRINNLNEVTEDVVEAAASALLIGHAI